MWRRRLDLTLKPLLQLDSAHTKDFSAEKDFRDNFDVLDKREKSYIAADAFVCESACWRTMGKFSCKCCTTFHSDSPSFAVRCLWECKNAMKMLLKPFMQKKTHFFIRMLFDMASSVSVWVLWTCRTQSAGVAKWMFSHRSHDKMLMFSVFSSCWKRKEIKIVEKFDFTFSFFNRW